VDSADRLIESTRALLWERGYVGTSPRAIQDRAGVGQGSMYHHFDGKPALALAAITRSGEQLQAAAEEQLAGPGTAYERIAGYLHREREVLRGCPIGRLTQDPDIVADPTLRAPVTAMFGWLQERIGGLLEEGRRSGELDPGLDPVTTAATVVAVLQGGYVLARAAGDPEPFDRAITGVLDLLARAVRPES
jgi:TetR/AcrR family transcriptional repressor of nem operon